MCDVKTLVDARLRAKGRASGVGVQPLSFDVQKLEKMIFGSGDNTVGNPNRAQISRFELFELILLSKLDKKFPVERFEATVSQSTVLSPS